MIYALFFAGVIGLLTLPIVLLLFTIVSRAGRPMPRSESLLLAMTLAPLVPLLEVLGLSLAPMERPLQSLLPWAHIGLIVAGAAMVGLRRCRNAAAEAARRVRRCFCALEPATRTVACIALAVLVFAFAHAAWNAGDEHDGAMYRLPIVMQPVQDGRVGPVAHPPPNFADAYPRTIEYLYSWTMLCSGTSVGFHLVNWYFLCLFGLATFVAARRARLRLRPAVLSSILVVTTPMPVYLTGILYNDLGPAALLTAGLAFALPPRRRQWGRRDLLGCSAALGLGASAKLTVAVCAAVLVTARVILMMLPRARRGQEGRGVSIALAAAGFAIAGMVASLQYLRTWVVYGSPVWPLRMSVGDMVIFDGPYKPGMLMITAKGSFVERWATSVYKLFQTTSQDANGAFGLLFAIAIVPALLWIVWRAARRPTPVAIFFLLIIVATVAYPAASNLRYSMHLLPLCYIALMCMLASVAGRRRRLFAVVIGVFVAVNSIDYARTVVKEVVEQMHAGVSLLDPQRNRAWYYQFAYWPNAAHPKTHTAVHRLVRSGERLVYATIGFPGMLYDPGYTYAVEYRAIPPGAADGRAWLASLHEDDIDAVLVHAGSLEDQTLAREDAGYELVYDQPEVEMPRRARVYRRMEGH